MAPLLSINTLLSNIANLYHVISGRSISSTQDRLEAVDFNGNASHLPPIDGSYRVGVHDFVIQDDDWQFPSAAHCKNGTAEDLSHDFSQDGI